ncbi:MAG: vWA domain-containing protein [Methylocella sp.]
MNYAFATPAVLWLLPLALLPFFASPFQRVLFPSLAEAPDDLISRIVDIGLRLAAVTAIGAIVLGLAGPYRLERTIERIGRGAHVVLLIDRSESMDETFAGRAPTGGETSKSIAARRILKDFVLERPHDEYGMVAFSTLPMFVIPITEHRDAILAAIDAIGRPALALTDVGRGLAMALGMFEEGTPIASRVVLFVSDGAAVIDRRTQDALRSAIAKDNAHIYWLFLRTANSSGISDLPGPGVADTPQEMPERHLDLFFKSLKIPYRAFEAESPQAIADALAEIGRLETNPIRYVERIPRQDISEAPYMIAATAMLLLVLAKLAEVGLTRADRTRHGAAS